MSKQITNILLIMQMYSSNISTQLSDFETTITSNSKSMNTNLPNYISNLDSILVDSQLQDILNSGEPSDQPSHINTQMIFPALLVSLAILLFIVFIFCVNCSFCPPKCLLDIINPGEYVAGGAVAKFVTSITILMLLTLCLIANILISTQGYDVNEMKNINENAYSQSDTFALYMDNGTDNFYTFRNIYSNLDNLKDQQKDINDNSVGLRTLAATDISYTDLVGDNSSDGSIDDFMNTYASSTVTQPDGVDRATNFVTIISTVASDLKLSATQCFSLYSTSFTNLKTIATTFASDWDTLKYNLTEFAMTSIESLQNIMGSSKGMVNGMSVRMSSQNEIIVLQTPILWQLVFVVLGLTLLNMFIVGVLTVQHRCVNLSIQLGWWLSGLASILGLIILASTIPVGIVHRDTCKVSFDHMSQYEAMFPSSVRNVFNGCAASDLSYQSVLSPFLDQHYNVVNNINNINTANGQTCGFETLVDSHITTLNAEINYLIPAEQFNSSTDGSVSNTVMELNKLTNVDNPMATSIVTSCSFVKDTWVFNADNCTGTYNSTDSDNLLDNPRCLVVADFTYAEFQSRYTSTYDICSNKSDIITLIDGYFSALKAFQTGVLTLNNNTDTNPETGIIPDINKLTVDNTNNTGVVPKLAMFASLQTSEIDPFIATVTTDTNSTIGAVLTNGHAMYSSSCINLRNSFDFYLTNQCTDNLQSIQANLLYQIVQSAVMFMLTCLLILQGRQNNKDSMHIQDVVMVREELRDEFSRIENFSMYGEEKDYEHINNLQQIDEADGEYMDNDMEGGEDNQNVQGEEDGENINGDDEHVNDHVNGNADYENLEDQDQVEKNEDIDKGNNNENEENNQDI